MNEFQKRTLFGALYIICVVGSILWSPIAFSTLFWIICVLAVDEFHRLVGSSGMLRIGAFIATTALWTLAQWFLLSPVISKDQPSWGIFFGLAYAPLLLIWMLDEIWNHSGRPVQNWGNLLCSQAMIALPLCSMSMLMKIDKWLLLALFVLIWINDTGAYCVGSLTAKRPQGNHKMAPHVSPKKSWEGLIGGIVFTLIGSLVLLACGWFDRIAQGGWTILLVLLFGILVSAFGTMGDLMESLLKRSVGVKDSGVFLPGHGGVLDRFDSILLAAPVITAYSWLCYFLLPLL